jgi:hypothetical protein
MAAGSILPGSALIPGFAFQKKKVHDTRAVYFTLQHPEGAALVELGVHAETNARRVAAEVNAAAGALRTRTDAPGQGQNAGTSMNRIQQLKDLQELRVAGTLTEAEFERLKREILDSP